MTTIEARLGAEFPPEEVRHFQGRGGQTFDYIEDETVMDRLDEVLGVGNWFIGVEPISVADGIVKVTLHYKTGDNGMTFYEDFGYASNSGPNAESLKEAVSDGIRRCGRYLGVGRYLYKKHGHSRSNVSQSPGRATDSSPTVRPARSLTTVPEPDDDAPAEPERLQALPGGATTASHAEADNSECPIHNVPWLGSWGDLWHKTDDGKYCRHPENTRQEGRQGARR